MWKNGSFYNRNNLHTFKTLDLVSLTESSRDLMESATTSMSPSIGVYGICFLLKLSIMEGSELKKKRKHFINIEGRSFNLIQRQLL